MGDRVGVTVGVGGTGVSVGAGVEVGGGDEVGVGGSGVGVEKIEHAPMVKASKIKKGNRKVRIVPPVVLNSNNNHTLFLVSPRGSLVACFFIQYPL